MSIGLLSGFSSSGHCIACGFLQFPCRDAHPGRSAVTFPCRSFEERTPPIGCTCRPRPKNGRPVRSPGYNTFRKQMSFRLFNARRFSLPYGFSPHPLPRITVSRGPFKWFAFLLVMSRREISLFGNKFLTRCSFLKNANRHTRSGL